MNKILILVLRIGFYYEESYGKYYFDYNNILYSFCIRENPHGYYLTRSDKNIENDFKLWNELDVDVDDIPDEQEVEKKLDDTNPDFVDTPKKDPKVIGNKYTFDFEAVMKAIDDTGKCSKDKSNDLNPDCSSKCSEQPKVVPPGSIVAQYQGYFYDSIQGKCIEVTGQSGRLGSMDECEKCNCGGKDPVGDKVKSGLNNDVDPVNTKISDEL